LFIGAGVVSSSGDIIENNNFSDRSLKSISSSEELLSRGKTAYAYIAYSPVGPEGPCYFDLDDPGDVELLAPTQSGDFLTGGTYSYEYGWFAIQYNNGILWHIDTDTGDMDCIGGGGVGVGDIAWDDCTSMLYGTSSTSFYEIDPESGGQTNIGGSSGIDIKGLAFDSNCICYGVGYNGSALNLYTIEFYPLEITFVAPITNFNCVYYCNAEFDKDIDVLYLINGASLYTCDTETGECTIVGSFGGAELTALAIPYEIQPQYTPHDPIYIHGNDDFTSENGVTSGSGTANDPYIIEYWNISAASQDGITIKNTSVFFEIRDCYVHDGGINNDGIVFYNVTNGVIKNNIVTGNRNGTIFRTQGYGMKENSSFNKIQQNTISDNIYDGIHFQHTTVGHHSNNEIFLNNITGNGNRGIYLIMSDENLVYCNNIISNSGFGVELFTCTGGGGNNRVYHNNFINNGGENGQASCTLDYNDWDDGYPSGGNYWYDYEGVDNYSGPGQNIPGSDGIGDEPYMIFSYYENDYDWYPLMEPYGDVTIPPYTKISLDPSKPDGCNGWYVSNVTVTLTASDDTGVNATYYRINSGVWEIYTEPFVISEDGEDILIEYYSVDIDGNVETVKSKTINIDQTPPDMTVEWEVKRIGWRKWQITFYINFTDNTSGIDRIEIYFNDVLQETIVGPGPTYSWSLIIAGGTPFTFKFVAYDQACNQAVVIVNSSDINPHPSIQYSYTPLVFKILNTTMFRSQIIAKPLGV